MRTKISRRRITDEYSRTKNCTPVRYCTVVHSRPSWAGLSATTVSNMLAYPGLDTIIQILSDGKTTSTYILNAIKHLQRIRSWSAVLQCDRRHNMCFVLCTRAVFTERAGSKHILAWHLQILAPLAPPWIRHCPWKACDAPDRPMVPLTSLRAPGRPVLPLTGVHGRPVVFLTGLWCPGASGRDWGAPDKPVMPLAGLWCPC